MVFVAVVAAVRWRTPVNCVVNFEMWDERARSGVVTAVYVGFCMAIAVGLWVSVPLRVSYNGTPFACAGGGSGGSWCLCWRWWCVLFCFCFWKSRKSITHLGTLRLHTGSVGADKPEHNLPGDILGHVFPLSVQRARLGVLHHVRERRPVHGRRLLVP